MSEPVYDWWGEPAGRVATQCDVGDYPTHSRILDKDGNPLQYDRPKIGFDLTPRGRK